MKNITLASFGLHSHLRQYWHKILESLWFVPGLMVFSSFGLAYGLIYFDATTSWQGEKRYPLLFGAGAEGARGMLTAIAGSMLTVAALVFSLTLSTITQVSSQYSPRLLRNFMNDRPNQVVMGYFVGVFAYCLIVLGTIRGTGEEKFVPATAVLIGLVLALGGVAALIFFVHHIAESLQTGSIVRHIFYETTSAIDKLFPDNFGEPMADSLQIDAALRYSDELFGWHAVTAGRTGYLQQINTQGLIKWAKRHRVLLRMEQRIGSFVGKDTRLFSICSDLEQENPEKADWPSDLTTYVSIGRHRLIDQDVAFGIQQLVDIVLKALSPGINDTTTAIMAVDYLGAVCGQLGKRAFPTLLRSDNLLLRVIVSAPDFQYYIRLAFDLPRINAKGNLAVIRRLMRALAMIAREVCSADRKPILLEQADLLLAQAQQTLVTEYEKENVQALYTELLPDLN